MDKIKILLLFAGIIVILESLASFLQFRSPLDLLFITMGMIAAINGFYIKDKEINETIAYFVIMCIINWSQWLILIYILFINGVYATSEIFILTIAPAMTLFLINRIIKYPRNNQKINNSRILDDKIKLILKDKIRFIMIFVGILLIFICLGSFLFSKNPVELFFTLVGAMAIIYGYYREDEKVKVLPPNYSKGMSRNFIYRDIKKVKVTPNYFVAMFFLFLLQWLILGIIVFVYPAYVTKEVLLSDVNYIAGAFCFAILASTFFFIQIQESKLVKINWQGIFIGKKKIF
ncbi:hypothetical protein BK007_01820 [Methanobacterium subterraneum]|uniref:Uncharacterized protein n=1 Tax=Methanobacterium subterraneum TaxID=59277 RepID=A0A2H4V9V5_9EURY|nr:hypothetical protein [Methanobacterium subterraneum]AUB54877.1 hypothetical protein BK007_01820 [Methanobacterium subterraneum]